MVKKQEQIEEREKPQKPDPFVKQNEEDPEKSGTWDTQK